MGMIGPSDAWCFNCGSLSAQYEKYCSKPDCQKLAREERQREITNALEKGEVPILFSVKVKGEKDMGNT